MSEDKNHTPLPYRTYFSPLGNPSKGWMIKAADEIETPIGILPDPMESGKQQANAEFIVRACNSHYELLELVKNQRAIFDCELIAPDVQTSHSKEFLEAILDRYDRAIAKAEGK